MKTNNCLEGRIFGKLTAIKEKGKDKYGTRLWECQCSCGNKIITSTNRLLRGNTKSCGCSRLKKSPQIGQRFDKLVVQKRIENKNNRVFWLCLCDCGKLKEASSQHLLDSTTRHCGCNIIKHPRRDDSIIGKKFGRLTVDSFSHYSGDRCSHYNCTCDCGNKTKTNKASLKNGTSKSCGCYKNELTGLRMYNPDVPDEVRVMWRVCKEYEKWVKDIRNKYNNQCDVCKNNKRLVSHHIKNWLSCPELRFNIDNGVCLCKECHYKFHSKYGLINNTQEQYIEFKGAFNEQTQYISARTKRGKRPSECKQFSNYPNYGVSSSLQ